MASAQEKRRDEIAALQEMIQSIRVCMFTTFGTDGRLHSRPMLTAKSQFDGDLWFFTRTSHGLVADVQQGARVLLAYACPRTDQYVSVEGLAAVEHDPQKQEVFWDDELEPWFPDGLRTDDLALVKVGVERADMWDAHTSKFGKAISYVKSMLTGKETEPCEHSTLSWDTNPSTQEEQKDGAASS